MSKALSLKYRRTIQLASERVAILGVKLLVIPLATKDVSGLTEHPLGKRNYLIVSNHRRGLDPFVIVAALSYRDFLKLSPISAMTKNQFYDSPLKPFAYLLGCFPARTGKRNHHIYGVDGSIALLDHNFSILIFPQGKCIKPGQPDVAPHTGITRIHHVRPDVPMILCHIEYNGLRALWKRRLFTISFRVVEKPHYKKPEEIMEDIYAIPLP